MFLARCRRIKETIANHKGMESRFAADIEFGIPQKKERRRQRVALGKAPSLEEGKQHKDMMVSGASLKGFCSIRRGRDTWL